jgi:hypothetical protein
VKRLPVIDYFKNTPFVPSLTDGKNTLSIGKNHTKMGIKRFADIM